MTWNLNQHKLIPTLKSSLYLWLQPAWYISEKTENPPPVQLVEVSHQQPDTSYAIIDDTNPAAFASIDDILSEEGVEIKQPGSQDNRSFDEEGSVGKLDDTGSLRQPEGVLSVSEVDAGSLSQADMDLGTENQGFDDAELANPSAHSISSIEPDEQSKWKESTNL